MQIRVWGGTSDNNSEHDMSTMETQNLLNYGQRKCYEMWEQEMDMSSMEKTKLQ